MNAKQTAETKGKAESGPGRAKTARVAEETDSWQKGREREREEDRKRLVKRVLPIDESAPLVRKLQKEADETNKSP